mgnify:CR=1 FL=1
MTEENQQKIYDHFTDSTEVDTYDICFEVLGLVLEHPNHIDLGSAVYKLFNPHINKAIKND